MNVISKIKRIEWENMFGRKTNVQMAAAFICGIGSEYFERCVQGRIDYKLAYFNGKTTYFYSSKKEYKRLLKNIRKKSIGNINFVINYKINHDKIVRNAWKKIRSLLKTVKKVKNKELIKIFNRLLEIEDEFYFYGYMNFLWDSVLIDLVYEGIVKKNRDEKEASRLLEIFSLPGYPPPVVKEQINLLSIAKKNLSIKSKRLDKLLNKHLDDFGWMAVYNFSEPMFKKDYYFKEYKKLKSSRINFRKKIEEIKKQYKSNEINYKKELKKFENNKKLYAFIKLLHSIPNLRDEREEFRDKMVYEATNIYKEIARRIIIPLKIVVNFTNEEIISALNGKKIEKINLECRKRNYILYFEKRKFTLIDKINTKLINSFDQSKKEKIIKGMIAYRGHVKGKAKLIFSSTDFGKFNSGDIFVTTMTKPNFVPIIKKASAIVTDEGSILCHAAIVAREFKIPTIIGTKIATKVLKDGDLVEVDANKGIVKIIKKVK